VPLRRTVGLAPGISWWRLSGPLVYRRAAVAKHPQSDDVGFSMCLFACLALSVRGIGVSITVHAAAMLTFVCVCVFPQRFEQRIAHMYLGNHIPKDTRVCCESLTQLRLLLSIKIVVARRVRLHLGWFAKKTKGCSIDVAPREVARCCSLW
jgi:hypothetical protein